MNDKNFNIGVGVTLFIIGAAIFFITVSGVIPNITYTNLWGVECHIKDILYILSGFLQFAGLTGILTDITNR